MLSPTWKLEPASTTTDVEPTAYPAPLLINEALSLPKNFAYFFRFFKIVFIISLELFGKFGIFLKYDDESDLVAL